MIHTPKTLSSFNYLFWKKLPNIAGTFFWDFSFGNVFSSSINVSDDYLAPKINDQ